MIRTQISFDSELYRRAQRLAKQRHVSLAELCRRGLREEIARETDDLPWMRFAGAFASDDAGASASVDDVVYGRAEP